VLTRGEWLQRQSPGSAPVSDPTELFVVAIRLHNLGEQPVVALQGGLKARDAREYLPMDVCWIETGPERTIPPGSSIEVVCRSRPGVTEQDRAFVAGAPGRFQVEWTPKLIRLADGSEHHVPY
jgi:hypothetical protein